MIQTEPIFKARALKNLELFMESQCRIPKLLLMESAGILSAKKINCYYPNGAITIVAGKGGNGGYGFAVARHLYAIGRQVTIVTLTESMSYRNETRTMWRAVETLAIPVFDFLPKKTDVFIDAIFGIGFRGELPETIAEIILKMNHSSIPIVSLDIPSGLTADSQKSPNVAIRATRTLCYGFKKICHVLHPASNLVGQLEVVQIGLITEAKPPSWRSDKQLVSRDSSGSIQAVVNCQLPKRSKAGHKNTFGHVLIIGGSLGLLGAPILAGIGALRAGAGLVTVIVPFQAMAMGKPEYPPELMVSAVPSSGASFTENDADFILKFIQHKKIASIVIGNGLGPNSCELVIKILENISIPVVVDADALEVFLKKFLPKSDIIIATPHPGEFQKYFDSSTPSPDITMLKGITKKLGIQLVFKSVTPVAICEEEIFIFPKSFSSLAKAGSGDILAGLIGGLLAQGLGAKSVVFALWILKMAGCKLDQAGLARPATAQEISLACREVIQDMELSNTRVP